MPFLQLGEVICGSELPSILWIFDPSTAPPLLFYSYIPIIFASLLMALYVFFSERRSLQAKLLLAVTLSFVLWVLNILVQWIGSYHTLLMFSWQLTAILETSIFISTFYFCYAFFYKKDLTLNWKISLGLIILAVICITPTIYNIEAYDVFNCEGVNGLLWQILYSFEPGLIVLMVAMGIDSYRNTLKKEEKGQILLLTLGVALFLGTFFLSNYYGELTRVYEFNLWGPLGFAFFLILLAYMIVHYHTFNVKLIATQALVVGISVLIGAQLFHSENMIDTTLAACTLAGFMVSGGFLIRSVKREIEQRVHIEQLAVELQETNARQETLMHYIGHEVKGFLTKDINVFASLVDGDFGKLEDGMKPFVENALAQSRDGARSVTDILTASNQKKGTIEYAKAPIDLKALIVDVVQKAQATATQKHLVLSFSAEDPGVPYTIKGDKEKLAENVFRNIIDNSINYTPSGSITATLKKVGKSFVFTVKDTGVGITAEDKKNLFTEGGHGKDSQRVNAHSTGYGLYIAKNIVVAHGGTIRAESEGTNKGSTFIVELPA